MTFFSAGHETDSHKKNSNNCGRLRKFSIFGSVRKDVPNLLGGGRIHTPQSQGIESCLHANREETEYGATLSDRRV